MGSAAHLPEARGQRRKSLTSIRSRSSAAVNAAPSASMCGRCTRSTVAAMAASAASRSLEARDLCVARRDIAHLLALAAVQRDPRSEDGTVPDGRTRARRSAALRQRCSSPLGHATRVADLPRHPRGTPRKQARSAPGHARSAAFRRELPGGMGAAPHVAPALVRSVSVSTGWADPQARGRGHASPQRMRPSGQTGRFAVSTRRRAQASRFGPACDRRGVSREAWSVNRRPCVH